MKSKLFTKNKIGRLEIIVFACGAVVMVLELIGSRIFSPYLGNSIFVWSSLIGIILAALSLGYYLGGKLSIKNPSYRFLSLVLFFSSLTIIFIPIFKKEILLFCMSLGIQAGSIVAALLLFAIPNIFLGIISPYAIRLKTESIEQSGGTAGNLYAISTIGSIVGTFLAGFYLIPHFTNNTVLFSLSLILLLLSLLLSFSYKKSAVLILIFGLWYAVESLPANYILETDSAYNHIRVADLTINNQKIRALILATEIHSAIYLDSDKLFTQYHNLYRLDSLFKSKIKTGLSLGGGACVAPRDFLKRFPDGKMTVVEIDPTVTQVGKTYFGVTDDPRLSIITDDARIFLNNNKEKFDAIYIDAFNSYYSVPFHLTTKESMQEISDALADNGIVLMNVIASLEGKKSLFFQAEYKTLQQVFPQIYVFPAQFYNGQNQNEQQNIVVLASKNPVRLSYQELSKNASAEQKELLNHLIDDEIKINQKTKVLTDEFAPVDYYISKIL